MEILDFEKCWSLTVEGKYNLIVFTNFKKYIFHVSAPDNKFLLILSLQQYLNVSCL
jgi:hypothetical protein